MSRRIIRVAFIALKLWKCPLWHLPHSRLTTLPISVQRVLLYTRLIRQSAIGLPLTTMLPSEAPRDESVWRSSPIISRILNPTSRLRSVVSFDLQQLRLSALTPLARSANSRHFVTLHHKVSAPKRRYVYVILNNHCHENRGSRSFPTSWELLKLYPLRELQYKHRLSFADWIEYK
jgi:hypothetical protein